MSSRAAFHFMRHRCGRRNQLSLLLPSAFPLPSSSLLHPTLVSFRQASNISLVNPSMNTVRFASTKGNDGDTAMKKSATSTKPKLPPALSTMLAPKRNEGGFPKPHRMSQVIRRVHQALITTDRLESVLLSHFSRKNMDKLPVTMSKMDSKKFMMMWEKKGEGQRMEALQGMQAVYVEIMENGKPEKTIHRVCYLILFLRLGRLVEEVVGNRNADELKFLEDFCSKAAEKFDCYVLAYYYWIALIKADADTNVERAHRLASKHPALLAHLDREMFIYGREYSKMEEKPSTVIYKGMPGVFVLGEIERFSKKLMDALEKQRLDEVSLSKIVALKSLALWNAGYCAKALSGLAAAMETWLKALDDEKSRTELGVSILLTFGDMLRERKEVDLAPAHEFLILACDKLSRSYGTALVPYFYWVMLNGAASEGEDGDARQRADDLLRRYPGIESLRSERLETHMTKSTPIATKRHFFGEWLKTLDLETARVSFAKNGEEINVNDLEREAQGNQKISLSKETMTELLDIRVLGILKSGGGDDSTKCPPIADLVAAMSSCKGVFPSDEALLAVADRFISKGDASDLEDLKLSLPLQSPAADRVYSYETGTRLKTNHRDKWMAGQRVEAVLEVISCYQAILEEEFHVSSTALSSIQTKIRNYLRLYLEDSLTNGDDDATLFNEIFSAVELRGRLVSDVHGDFSLLAYCWETLFFSGKFEMQERADKFLVANPKLPHYLDADHLLARANRFNSEPVFRRLVQMCLLYDQDDYEKTRFFEGLLVCQCEKGNPVSSGATLDYAKQNGISIGADAMEYYLELKEDVKNSKGSGFLSRFLGKETTKK